MFSKGTKNRAATRRSQWAEPTSAGGVVTNLVGNAPVPFVTSQAVDFQKCMFNTDSLRGGASERKYRMDFMVIGKVNLENMGPFRNILFTT